MSIVAVVSGLYCSGDEIAKEVAKKLNYTLIGPELVADAADKFDTSVEKISQAMTGVRKLFNIFTHDHEKSVVYIKAALAELVAKDNTVYHGVATHLIPRDITHVLRVGIIADHDYRVTMAHEREQLQAAAAKTLIDKDDKALAAWTQEQMQRTPWDPSLFDLQIPPSTHSVDEAVKIILENHAKDPLRPTDRSIQAALDFLLATRVNLALLERGHYSCDVTAHHGAVEVIMKSKPSPAGQLGRTMHALKQESAQDTAYGIAKGIEGVLKVKVRPAALPSKTLLVDDEREYVMTLSERLQMRDIPLDVAYDGQQALDAVKTAEPEVMILDLKMPGIDGIEVLRRIKRDHPNVQVIVVTGHGSEQDEKLVRELGAFDYLQKPVDINTLAEKIREASKAAKTTSDE